MPCQHGYQLVAELYQGMAASLPLHQHISCSTIAAAAAEHSIVRVHSGVALAEQLLPGWTDAPLLLGARPQQCLGPCSGGQRAPSALAQRSACHHSCQTPSVCCCGARRGAGHTVVTSATFPPHLLQLIAAMLAYTASRAPVRIQHVAASQFYPWHMLHSYVHTIVMFA